MVYDDEEYFTDDEVEDDADEKAAQGSGASGETNKISLGEQIILILIAASADLFELIAAFALALPIVGWGVWALALLFGFVASAIIFLWSLLRGARGEMMVAKKVTVIVVSGLIDVVSGGVLPMRTIGLVIAIWLHNHTDQIDKLAKIVPAAQAVAKRALKK